MNTLDGKTHLVSGSPKSLCAVLREMERNNMAIREELKHFFDKNKIEYFSVLRYDDCKEINSRIIEREDFTPRSVIMYALPYYTGECVNMSVYASSLDYHIAIREVSQGITKLLEEHFPNCHAKGYGDHSPIDEIHAALISGLGIIGDSGLLINEKYGTYVFIGDVITDIDPLELGSIEPCEIKRCKSCGICKAKCPTGILRGESCVCLSAITQRKGELTDSEVALMRKINTVWGCDECQRYCPYNKEPILTPISFFYVDRIPTLTTELVDNMSKAEFEKRAFAWRGRKTVERNLKHLGY